MTRRVVIAGLPRCGTTVLARHLDSQPGVRFMPDYLPSFQHLPRRLRVAWRQPLPLRHRQTSLVQVSRDLLRLGRLSSIESSRFTTLDDLHRLALQELHGSDARVLGHKLVLAPRDIEGILSDTDIHVIVALRDPRDAAASYHRRTGAGTTNYVREWLAMSRWLRQRSHPRLSCVELEELVADPARSLDALHRELGLESPTKPSLERFDACRVTRRGPSLRERYVSALCQTEIKQRGYAPSRPIATLEIAGWHAASLAVRTGLRARTWIRRRRIQSAAGRDPSLGSR